MPKTEKRRGAPRNNRNAVRHGAYSGKSRAVAVPAHGSVSSTSAASARAGVSPPVVGVGDRLPPAPASGWRGPAPNIDSLIEHLHATHQDLRRYLADLDKSPNAGNGQERYLAALRLFGDLTSRISRLLKHKLELEHGGKDIERAINGALDEIRIVLKVNV